jgi:hypothetical protein
VCSSDLKDKPFNLACRVLAGANPRGFSSSFSVSASHSYQYNHLMITTIISPAIKKGPSWLKATRVEKDTFPLMRPIESPSPPFIWSEDLVLDIPVGFEFGFRNFAFSVYGSYSRYLVNYSQEIVNAGFYENVISFSPRHHFTVGFITSFFRY